MSSIEGCFLKPYVFYLIIAIVLFYLSGETYAAVFVAVSGTSLFLNREFRVIYKLSQVYVGENSVLISNCFFRKYSVDCSKAKRVEFFPWANRTVGKFVYLDDRANEAEVFFMPNHNELNSQVGLLQQLCIVASNKEMQRTAESGR